MFLFGVLIGLFEIVVGVITLVNSKGEMLLVVAGAVNILSGLLFLWFCYGAQTAFDHRKDIENIKSELEKANQKNKYLEEEIEKLKSDKKNESK